MVNSCGFDAGENPTKACRSFMAFVRNLLPAPA